MYIRTYVPLLKLCLLSLITGAYAWIIMFPSWNISQSLHVRMYVSIRTYMYSSGSLISITQIHYHGLEPGLGARIRSSCQGSCLSHKKLWTAGCWKSWRLILSPSLIYEGDPSRVAGQDQERCWNVLRGAWIQKHTHL